MAIVSEALDAIGAVSEAIGNIRTIAEAVREGRDYLKITHPEVAEDLAAMCEEMRKSSHALASASSIVTHFRFVVGDTGDGQAAEAARFNEHLLRHKAQAERVRQLLDSMRGHCSTIEGHAAFVRGRAEAKGLRSLFSLLGLRSEAREDELADALQRIYNEELDYHRNVSAMAHAIATSLAAVQEALGPPGILDPAKVPEAARILGAHAEAFARIEADCNFNALELQESVDRLRSAR